MTFLLTILSAHASNGLVSETQTEHGYICEYEQCDYVDEEGFEQAGGPNFTMYSTTPCPASVGLEPIVIDNVRASLAVHEGGITLVPDPAEPGEPGEPQYNIQICFGLSDGTDFCYESDAHWTCDAWRQDDPPANHTCHDVV